jgi:two-component system, chemotaxis family, protein-glutamate methylesterase/glutaminase
MLSERTSAEAIVIGASAGAIEALRRLLPALTPDLPVPIVVVVHLPPRRASMLPDLFSRLCHVPVREPVDKQPVAAGTIWFAPADYHLMIERGRTFSLSVDAPVGFSRPSVDVLFESAACVYGARIVAIVLSGANPDGAQGARAIRDAGGYVLVQDPAEADMREMPDAAIRHADPQFVGPIAALARTARDLTGAHSCAI